MSTPFTGFETLSPSTYQTFHVPNTLSQNRYFTTAHIRVLVIDSPYQTAGVPPIAAMIVPFAREADWIFTTPEGRAQLLYDYPPYLRLILIGNTPSDRKPTDYTRVDLDSYRRNSLQQILTPLVRKFCPISSYVNGIPQFHFVSYNKDRNIVSRKVLGANLVGTVVGEILIDNVEVDTIYSNDREFRRRLTYKRTPNFIQTQVRVVPSEPIEQTLDMPAEFLVDTEALIQPSLIRMVTGLSKIAPYLDQKISCGYKPRALCLGVGGGALVSFLNAKLEFEVVGVEADEDVLQVGKRFFGLKDGEFVRLIVGNAIHLTEELAHHRQGADPDEFVDLSSNYMEFRGDLDLIQAKKIHSTFDILMVDLVGGRIPVSAPVEEFVNNSVLSSARAILHERGVIVINVVLPFSDRRLYNDLVRELRVVFAKVYEIVRDQTNLVLIAAASSLEGEKSFSMRLSSVISEAHLKSIVQI